MQDTFWSLLLALGGVQAVVGALTGWLGALWLKRAEQRLQASIDVAVHARTVQFNWEFETYKSLWSRLCDVRSAVRELSFFRDGRDASFESTQANYQEAVTALRAEVERNRPFFAAAIQMEIAGLLDLVREEQERDAAERAQGPITIIHAKGVRNLHSINVASLKICEAIRDRVTGAAVPS